MKKADEIRVFISETLNNEGGLLEACDKYPLPTNQKELDELNALIGELRGIKMKTPRDAKFCGTHKTLTWCIVALEEVRSDYDYVKLVKKLMKGE